MTTTTNKTTVKKIGPGAYEAVVNGRKYSPICAFSDAHAVVVAEKTDHAMQTTKVVWDGD